MSRIDFWSITYYVYEMVASIYWPDWKSCSSIRYVNISIKSKSEIIRRNRQKNAPIEFWISRAIFPRAREIQNLIGVNIFLAGLLEWFLTREFKDNLAFSDEIRALHFFIPLVCLKSRVTFNFELSKLPPDTQKCRLYVQS